MDFIILRLYYIILAVPSLCCPCIIYRARKLLHLHDFFEPLDLLLSELEIHSKTLRKTYQKFTVHIFAYLMILLLFKL